MTHNELEVLRLRLVVSEKEYMEAVLRQEKESMEAVLRQENALQADVIEGFLTSQMSVAYDMSRTQVCVRIVVSEEEICCNAGLPESVGARVTAHFRSYLHNHKDVLPKWLDQKEKSKTPS
jgi:hypothetical protein